MAEHKLIGKNYTTPDLVAKVTGKARYAEDWRAEGMLFAKLLLSPRPHARVVRIDASEALAMPGVHAILTADDMVVNAVAARPYRLEAVETFLKGKPRNAQTADAAGEIAVQGALPLRHNAYKVPLVKALVKRAIRGAGEWTS